MLCLEAANLLRISCRLCAFEGINLHLFKRSLYSTFTARDLLAHESHGDTGTLSTRFIKHLAIESCKFDPIIPTTIKYSDYYPIHDIQNFNKLVQNVPLEQIPRLIVFTYTYKTNGDQHKVASVLNKIDEICTQRIEQLDYDGILRILQAFMFVIPNKITKLTFYEVAVRRLVEDFQPSYTEEKFVQACFYLGLWKRNVQSTKLMNNFIRSHLPKYINDLSTLDFAIVSNATYKTSLPVNMDAFSQRLVQELEHLDCKDDALFVTFIKCLRLNRIKSVKLYEKIKSHLVSGEMDNFHFKGLIHCLAYFAEGLWNDPEVCKAFIAKCLERLENINTEEYVFNDLRAKDFATFLWSCANLSPSELGTDELHLLEAIILEKVQCNEYRNCPDELIDSALSLWMLNYKSRDIISSILQLKQAPSMKKSERIKLESRYRLLLNCVEIENPEWLGKKLKGDKTFIEDREAPTYLIENRTALQSVKRVLDEEKTQLGILSSTIVCPIRDINIAGILVDTKDEKYYLEVLEDKQILKFSNQPIAIVQLKINLLKALGYKVQVVASHEYENDDEILSVLKNKLSCADATLNVKEAVA